MAQPYNEEESQTFKYYPSASTGIFGSRLRPRGQIFSEPESTTYRLPLSTTSPAVNAQSGMDIVTNMPAGPISQNENTGTIILSSGGSTQHQGKKSTAPISGGFWKRIFKDVIKTLAMNYKYNSQKDKMNYLHNEIVFNALKSVRSRDITDEERDGFSKIFMDRAKLKGKFKYLRFQMTDDEELTAGEFGEKFKGNLNKGLGKLSYLHYLGENVENIKKTNRIYLNIAFNGENPIDFIQSLYNSSAGNHIESLKILNPQLKDSSTYTNNLVIYAEAGKENAVIDQVTAYVTRQDNVTEFVSIDTPIYPELSQGISVVEDFSDEEYKILKEALFDETETPEYSADDQEYGVWSEDYTSVLTTVFMNSFIQLQKLNTESDLTEDDYPAFEKIFESTFNNLTQRSLRTPSLR